MDEDFWSMFYRLMAFETQDDSKTSLGYVNKATPLLEKSLSTTTDAGKTLRELYLLSEYNRRLGRDDEAKRYLERLKTTEVNEDLSDFKKYLLEISEAQRTAMPAR
jgi:flagellar biosynthesis regulator FlbT